MSTQPPPWRRRAKKGDRTRTAAIGTCGTCEKLTFSTKAQAREHARWTDRHNGGPRDPEHPIRPYWCALAHGFHIGHQPLVRRANLNDPRLTFLPGEA